MYCKGVMALVSGVAAAALLTACGNSSDGGGQSGGGSGGSSGGLRVGISLPGLDEYNSEILKAAQKEATAKGVTLVSGAGNFTDPAAQVTAVQNLLAQNIKVLIISPMGDPLKPVLNKAVGMGIKVIFVDGHVANWNKESTFIGTDGPAGSTTIGNYLVKKLGGHGKVGIAIGVPGIPVLTDRYTNAKKILEDAGITVYLTSQADYCEEAKAIPVIQNLLVAHPDLDAIYTSCGPSGIAAGKVVAKRSGGKGNTVIASWDVEIGQIKDIIGGQEDAAIAQFPVKMGTTGVDKAMEAASGANLPKYIDNGSLLVTKDNADKFFHDAASGYSYLAQ